MPKPIVNKELLLEVAKNARLKLTEEEIEKFLPQFKEVLDSFSKLDEINVSKEEPSFQPILVKNVFREDVVKESVSQETALSNTPHKKEGYFKGPKVA